MKTSGDELKEHRNGADKSVHSQQASRPRSRRPVVQMRASPSEPIEFDASGVCSQVFGVPAAELASVDGGSALSNEEASVTARAPARSVRPTTAATARANAEALERELLLCGDALFSRTIRVYVSSAGGDTNAERDWLQGTAFAAARERAHRLGFELVLYDLRLGTDALLLDDPYDAAAHVAATGDCLRDAALRTRLERLLLPQREPTSCANLIVRSP